MADQIQTALGDGSGNARRDDRTAQLLLQASHQLQEANRQLQNANRQLENLTQSGQALVGENNQLRRRVQTLRDLVDSHNGEPAAAARIARIRRNLIAGMQLIVLQGGEQAALDFDQGTGRGASMWRLETRHFFGSGTEESTNGFQEEESEKCPVCYDEYSAIEVGRQRTMLPCGHVLHEACLREWLRQSMRCPSCRGELVWTLARRDRLPNFGLHPDLVAINTGRTGPDYHHAHFLRAGSDRGARQDAVHRAVATAAQNVGHFHWTIVQDDDQFIRVLGAPNPALAAGNGQGNGNNAINANADAEREAEAAAGVGGEVGAEAAAEREAEVAVEVGAEAGSETNEEAEWEMEEERRGVRQRVRERVIQARTRFARWWET